MNNQNLIDCRYAQAQLRGIVIGNAATHDRVRRALDALERIEGRLVAVVAADAADVPANAVVRCGVIVDGATGEQR